MSDTPNPRGLTHMKPGDAPAYSPWLEVTQDDVTAFGAATKDMDPMHVDPEWSVRNGPFGGTISFGFYTLSLLTYFSHQVFKWERESLGLNYGFDRVRFVAPVPVGAWIRARFAAKRVDERPDGSRLITLDSTIEIRDQDKPAASAEWLVMALPG